MQEFSRRMDEVQYDGYPTTDADSSMTGAAWRLSLGFGRHRPLHPYANIHPAIFQTSTLQALPRGVILQLPPAARRVRTQTHAYTGPHQNPYLSNPSTGAGHDTNGHPPPLEKSSNHDLTGPGPSAAYFFACPCFLARPMGWGAAGPAASAAGASNGPGTGP
eukprot:gene8066-195_t